MFRDREEIRRRLFEVVERFRQKGATTPEKAMSAQELGLPPRFEEAMHRRLGQTGIFVEVNGKYYLNEERLRQVREQRGRRESGEGGGGGGGNPRRTLMALRLARFASTLVLLVLVAANLFYPTWELMVASVGFFVFWVALFAAFYYYRARLRRRFLP